jgi:hypothetical protein
MVCILIGVLGKIAPLAYLAGVLIPLQVIGSFSDLIKHGNNRFTAMAMDSNIGTTIISALMLLPMLFLFRRGDLLIKHRRKTARHKQDDLSVDKPKKPIGFFIRIMLFTILLIGAIQFLLYYLDRSAGISPIEPVRRTEEIDEFGGINEKNLTADSQESVFLERRILTIAVEAKGYPRRFDLYVKPDSDTDVPSIYSATFSAQSFGSQAIPFRLFLLYDEQLEFILGENPPNPFRCEIVLPWNFSGTLHIKAVYNTFDPAIDKDPAPLTEDYIFVLSKTIAINKQSIDKS